MLGVSPDMFQDVAPTAIVLGGNFEYSGGSVVHAADDWPELSVEARMRLTAFGVVACSKVVSGIKQAIFSGGIEALMATGDVVEEADVMERFFHATFDATEREGLAIIKDDDCSTTRTSAQSVGRLLMTHQPDHVVLPYPLVTSKAHVPRAENEFSEREGIPVRLWAAEQILLNAGAFGWESERASKLSQQAKTYLASWRGRRMSVQERIYRTVSSSPLGDIAERRAIAHRTLLGHAPSN